MFRRGAQDDHGLLVDPLLSPLAFSRSAHRCCRIDHQSTSTPWARARPSSHLRSRTDCYDGDALAVNTS